jgi:hypothetical protein
MTIAERPTILELRRENKPNTSQLLKELVSNRYCQGLLRFFVVHPNGRFSKLAILHALDENGTRPEIENDLNKLVYDGVIKESVENRTCFYMLTNEEPTRHLVLNLAEFDWHQWQRLDHYFIADRRVSA